MVIDNPPFSIFTRIVRFYTERGIPFLLFAPSLTGLGEECTFIGTGVSVTYENGAVVNTSFVTNMMGDLICTSAPELRRMIKEANDANLRQTKKTLPKLAYPGCVLRASALHAMSNAGVLFQVSRSEGEVVGKATTRGKDFGNIVLLSDSKAAEKMAAEMTAAKKMAEKGIEIVEKETLELAEVSRQIIDKLNKKINI